MRVLTNGRQLWLICAIALTMTGCFSEKPFDSSIPGGNTGGGPTDPPPPANPPPPNQPPPPPPPQTNRAPRITGTPMTALRVGEAYAFEPDASDPDGDTLSFNIENRPVWVDFNRTTGRLSGVPGAGDVGQFSNVRITVSDGRGAQAALNAFRIDVTQVALGSVTLSWQPPTTNADGSPMTDLAGYRIYYGRTADTLDQIAPVDNAGTTRFVVDNLSPATWYFSMKSVNSAGIESSFSSVVSTNLT